MDRRAAYFYRGERPRLSMGLVSSTLSQGAQVGA